MVNENSKNTAKEETKKILEQCMNKKNTNTDSKSNFYSLNAFSSMQLDIIRIANNWLDGNF